MPDAFGTLRAIEDFLEFADLEVNERGPLGLAAPVKKHKRKLDMSQQLGVRPLGLLVREPLQ